MVTPNWRGFKSRILQVAQKSIQKINTPGRRSFVERTYIGYS